MKIGSISIHIYVKAFAWKHWHPYLEKKYELQPNWKKGNGVSIKKECFYVVYNHSTNWNLEDYCTQMDTNFTFPEELC